MRFFAPLFALFTATAVVAQTSGRFNVISNGSGRLNVQAGQNTIEWTNPSSGTVTIKLQRAGSSNIRPDTGYTLATSVSASALTYTVNIPADEVAPNVEYVYQIIDDTSSNGNTNANYSAPFLISGATGTNPDLSTSSSGTATITSTSSGTSTTLTETTITGTSTSTRSSTTSGTSSRTNTGTSTSTPSPTSAPGGGGALKLGAHSGLLAVIMGAAIVM